MAVSVREVDYARSTMAYPMPKDPQPIFVDNTDVDFSKSTGAYPMYDERNAPERTVEHIDAEPDVQFETPGAVSVELGPDATVKVVDAPVVSDTPKGRTRAQGK